MSRPAPTLDKLHKAMLEALRACEAELEFVRVHCRDARGHDVIVALDMTRKVIAKAEGRPSKAAA